MKNFSRDKRSDGGNSGKKYSGRRLTMHKAICKQCGDECAVPFKPTSDKPVFCDNCFKKGGKPNGDRFAGKFTPGKFARSSGERSFAREKAPDDYKRQFEMLNDKLDRILKALE